MKILEDLGLTRERVRAVCQRMGWVRVEVVRKQARHMTLTARMRDEFALRRGTRFEQAAYRSVRGGD